MERVHVIAELGVNHSGSVDKAKRMVRQAKRAGADYCKLQYYHVEDLYSPKHPYFKAVKKAQLSIEQIQKIKRYAEAKDLKFVCTVFKDPELVDDLESIGVEYFKIREADSGNYKLISRVLQTGRQMFISTLRLPADANLLYHPRIKWLLATPFYPCPAERMEIHRVPAFKGLSDHTKGITLALAAITVWLYSRPQGEFYLEKHVRLDRDEDCLEKEWSITFTQLANLIKKVEKLEKAKWSY